MDAGQAVGGTRVETERLEPESVERTTPTVDETGIVAELHLDHDRLPLQPTLRSGDDLTVVPEYRAQRNGRVYQFVSITRDDGGSLQSALERDPTVRNPVLVDRGVDHDVYRVELTEETITLSGMIADQGGRIQDAKGTKTAWVFQLRFPSRDALVGFNDECKSLDVSVQVTHLRSAESEEQPLLGLTEKQQELLTVAYEEGYFEVPRGISQDELADRLDVSKSAISQRLRRAMTELCATSLSS